jgi:hypothetical protein
MEGHGSSVDASSAWPHIGTLLLQTNSLACPESNQASNTVGDLYYHQVSYKETIWQPFAVDGCQIDLSIMGAERERERGFVSLWQQDEAGTLITQQSSLSLSDCWKLLSERLKCTASQLLSKISKQAQARVNHHPPVQQPVMTLVVDEPQLNSHLVSSW